MRTLTAILAATTILLSSCAPEAEPFMPNVMVGSDFTQNDQNGQPVSLSDFRGNVVLVEFWATWCPPCRAHTPWVKEVWDKYDDKNFTIIGVSLDYDLDAWKTYITSNDLSWVHVSDGQYWNNAVARQYDVRSTPTFMIFDAEGQRVGTTWRFNEIEPQIRGMLED